jgi:hypothetical protein
MKLIISIYVAVMLVAISLMLVTTIHWAEASENSVSTIRTDTLHEPLFGIEYHPSEIRFESAPDAIFKCSTLKKRRGDLFLFGKATKGKVRFYYVYGWEEVDWGGSDDGVRHFEAESDDGIIVIVSPGSCQEIGAGYALSPGKRERQMARKIGITDDVLSALISDAVDREIRALGGKSEFLRRLAATGIDESKLPAQVRNKLVVIRKDEGDKPLKPITPK